ALAHRPDALERFVRASTRLTHTDPRAEQAALAIAAASAHAANGGLQQKAGGDLLAALRPLVTDAALSRKLDLVEASLERQDSPEAFAAAMGARDGVSGFAPDSACAALFCWLRYPHSFADAVEAAICLGGDSDTTGAIVGGLAGAALGTAAIPRP